MTMPSRLNLALVFNNLGDVRKVVAEVLGHYSARVERWQIIDRDNLIDLSADSVQFAVCARKSVLVVTNLDPRVRAHFSRQGRFDVLTVSLEKGLQHLVATANALAQLEGVKAAGIGEELEVDLESADFPGFIGDDITMLKASSNGFLTSDDAKP